MKIASLTFRAVSLSILALLPATQLALAQDPVVGQREYREHCAACHGLEGRGDGPIGPFLKTPAPNLALIAARNGGIYPVQKVYEIIEGSSVIAAHGTRDMPLWGDRYRKSAAPVTPDQAAIGNDMAQQRILSLVYYLGTMQ